METHDNEVQDHLNEILISDESTNNLFPRLSRKLIQQSKEKKTMHELKIVEEILGPEEKKSKTSP